MLGGGIFKTCIYGLHPVALQRLVHCTSMLPGNSQILEYH